MEPRTCEILKGNDVRMVPAPPAPAGKSGRTASAPQARIIHKTDTFALVQVLCTCGKELTIRCDYDMAPSQGPADGR
jgi:hypothetical protein